jgi:capsular exopolysaccharide synthesis family protein
MEETPPSHSPIRGRRLLAFLLKYWWVPTFTLMLGVGAAVEYLRWAPSTFVSSASMWETEKLRLPEGGLFTGDMQNYLGTQVELLRSGELAQLAMQRLLASGSNAVPTETDGRMMKAQVSVAQVPKSSILVVEVASTNGAFSRAYLSALLNEYLDFKRNLRKSEADYTLASMSEQVLRLERELKNEQDKLTAYEQTNNLAILQEEGNVSGAYLAKLETQLSDSQLEFKLLKENEGDQAGGGTGGVGTKAVTPDAFSGQDEGFSGIGGNERRTAAREIEMLRMERERLGKFLRPKHPKIVKLVADIERAEKLNELFGAQSQKQLETSRQVLQSRIEGLRAAIKEWEARVMKANGGIAEAERLKLNVNRIQVVYDRMLGLLQNIDISRSIDQESLAILQPASPAVRSLKKEVQMAAASVLGGLFAGLGIVLLIAWRDDRFTSLSEMSEELGDVIVGQVPELPRPRGQATTLLLKAEDDRQMYAESYRNLRSALLFLPPSVERPKIILVTSAMPHEGKSTIASNLAHTLALGGSRVVLIDADLRQGHLHELLGMKREPGLAEALQRPEDLDKILQFNCLPNLSFISCGRALSRPGDLFVGPALEHLLARLRQQFDHVIIDTSPVFASDDVATLAPRADGTLLVVRNRVSRSGPVAEALELLCRRQAKILGVVVNGANAASKTYYYYKNADYYSPVADKVKKPSGQAGEAQQPRPR